MFGPRTEWLTNKFVWYGTSRPFECLTLTFRESEHGAFVAHHYRYAPDRSTFIVECDAATWKRAGLGAMDDAASRAYCEAVFAPDLDGHPLVSNRSIWRNFPMSNTRWSAGNTVLIGDALRTGHFSIGSGTRLAFDDAIALDRALAKAGDDVPGCWPPSSASAGPSSRSWWLPRTRARTGTSAWRTRWRSPVELAYDYMTRSGRVDDARLRRWRPFHGATRSGAPFARHASPIPCPRRRRRARDRVLGTRALQRVVAAVRQRRPPAGQDRARLRRRQAIARWPRWPTRRAPACADGPRARRSRAHAARRHAGVCRCDLRRVARRLRAGARQHAVAAGARCVLPVRQRRRGGVRRCAILDAALARGRVCNAPAPDRACGGTPDARCRNALRHEWSRGSPRNPARSSRPTPIATTWHSGCTARARPDGRRASCTCITTRSTRGVVRGACSGCVPTTSCSRRPRSSSPTDSATRSRSRSRPARPLS